MKAYERRHHILVTPGSCIDVSKLAAGLALARETIRRDARLRPGDFDTTVTDASLSASEAHRYSLLGPQVLRV